MIVQNWVCNGSCIDSLFRNWLFFTVLLMYECVLDYVQTENVEKTIRFIYVFFFSPFCLVGLQGRREETERGVQTCWKSCFGWTEPWQRREESRVWCCWIWTSSWSCSSHLYPLHSGFYCVFIYVQTGHYLLFIFWGNKTLVTY